jgi:hypothetical protein
MQIDVNLWENLKPQPVISTLFTVLTTEKNWKILIDKSKNTQDVPRDYIRLPTPAVHAI